MYRYYCMDRFKTPKSRKGLVTKWTSVCSKWHIVKGTRDRWIRKCIRKYRLEYNFERKETAKLLCAATNQPPTLTKFSILLNKQRVRLNYVSDCAQIFWAKYRDTTSRLFQIFRAAAKGIFEDVKCIKQQQPQAHEGTVLFEWKARRSGAVLGYETWVQCSRQKTQEENIAVTILSRVLVTVEGVWIDKYIYWPLKVVTANKYNNIADFHTINHSTLSLLSQLH
jgi:hypothetical protein